MRGGDSDITLKERRSEEEESEEENPKMLHRYLLVWLLGLTERDYHLCFFFLIFQFLLFLLCFDFIGLEIKQPGTKHLGYRVKLNKCNRR
jgi:hypothetical protein